MADGPADRTSELELCRACDAGDAEAQATFERRFVAPLAADDEVKQLVRQKLLVGRRLRDYSGQGDLGRWVKAVAARLAVDLKRGEREDAVEARVLEALLPGTQPEVEALRAEARATLAEAVRTALDGLEPRERLFVQHYHLDGLTLQAIGELYGVVPSTVMRALDKARTRMGALARQHLAERHGLGEQSIDSLVRAVQSHYEP